MVSSLKDRAGETAIVGDSGGVERREGIWGVGCKGGDDGAALRLGVKTQVVQLLSIHGEHFITHFLTLRNSISVHPL